jgi:hypothetical protein
VRYNRFLLDEVLWGNNVATPLLPIVTICLKQGEVGYTILNNIMDWWLLATNKTGNSRSRNGASISPVPEGKPLVEVEALARKKEPGDGTAQQSLVDYLSVTFLEHNKQEKYEA